MLRYYAYFFYAMLVAIRRYAIRALADIFVNGADAVVHCRHTVYTMLIAAVFFDRFSHGLPSPRIATGAYRAA